MDLRLAGKTAVVTGGSKGIGLETVRLLQQEGVKVVSGSRSITPQLKETGAYAVTVDLSTPDGPQRLIDEAVAHLGGIDILINNVGIGDSESLVEGATNTLLTLPDSAWESAFDLHFYSALRATRAALPSLIERKGVIVNVSSTGARLVGGGPVNYNVSKVALNALTKITAEQFGAEGVRAITVSPGPVSTGVWTDEDGFIGKVARAQGVTREQFEQTLLSQLSASTGRVSTPAEVAQLIVFAASPNNVTGTDYLVDGGMVKTA
ncbi:SDR family NAD(P)-dependent oxidoreductase [Kibdelosporangium aridum]|uniref:SDR family NAD(P)-dependent oxidoreductase n=1 Tax=Kibdelosporangium aridum TaxID=2030 RepID=UPI00056B12A7|nr:SDR family oxidoreductase [Kibdelosporangium aridum]